MMKRSLLLICSLFALNYTYAQKNPVAGFIVTNEGETINGTVDILSNVSNGKECHFCAVGSQEYRTYQPGSIRNYGTSDGGLLYESLRVPYDGSERTVFAEYLVKGGISLFFYTPRNGETAYFFVDEEGKVTTMTDPKSSSMDSRQLEKARHKAMDDATQVFSRDNRFVEKLLVSRFERRNLTKLTHEFNDLYCTNAGDCIEFNYNPKTAALVKARFLIEAGAGIGTIHADKVDGYSLASADAEFTSPMFRVAAGLDLAFPRYTNHISVQLTTSLMSYSCHKTLDDKDRSLKGFYWGIHPGITYKFLPKKAITPLVRAGINMDFPIGVKDENMEGYWVADRRKTLFSVEMGYYIGAGIGLNIGTKELRLTVDYAAHSAFNTPVYDYTTNNFMLSAGICL